MAVAAKQSPSRFRRPRRRHQIVLAVLLGLLIGPALLILLFRFVPPPMTPLMLLRLAQGYGWHQQWVPYDRIASSLPEAVIASEDNLFCKERFGFDTDALAAQIALWRKGERPRGASTITMQTARNLLLWPGRDPIRKVLEAWLTPQIAILWPKRRILEVYLNIVEFGPGVYGVETASRRYFSRAAANLRPDHAIRLAVILPSPLKWSPSHPSPHVQERTEVIERRISQLGPLLDCARTTD